MIVPAGETRWQSLRAPFRVSARRAAIEGAAGSLLLLLPGVFGASASVNTPPGVIFGLLAGLWLFFWPAWRLRPSRLGLRPLRLIRRIARVWLLGAALGFTWGVYSLITWPLVLVGIGKHSPDALWATLPAAFFFVWLRLATVVLAGLVRTIRRRLRWQLILSHLAVILLTFISLTAAGSVVGMGVLLPALHTDAPAMATAAAATLDALPAVRSRAALDPAQTRAALTLVENRDVVLKGETVINYFLRLVMPAQFVVLRPDGTLLAGSYANSCQGVQALTTPAWSLPAADANSLRRAALAGNPFAIVRNVPGCSDTPSRLKAFSAARLLNGAGKAVGVVVVETQSLDALTPSQAFAGTVAIFGVATFTLIMAWLGPSLVLSGLFGYVLARGLTRRIESVSRVTTAIATGDLAQRAPVNAHNEVGRLAANVNRMAAHLEASMNELTRAREQAVESLRKRQELVASISHELRTPLAIVQAHLDTLTMRQPALAGAGGEAEPEVTVSAQTVRALQNELDRLSSLVDDLFSLSRAETGALQVASKPVDVAELVQEVAALMRPLAQREGMIALSVEAPPGLPLALADEDRLRQIISNLVRNAVRHTPDGGIIVLSTGVANSWVVISVVDTGEGIPPEHLPHIFERFYRVDQARTRSSGGAGLGLAIVREFVELMGGRVTVESKVGEGSCFRVYLPCA